MNKRRLAGIANWLEHGAKPRKGVDHFNMEVLADKNSCGTACCIAGAACFFYSEVPEPKFHKGMGEYFYPSDYAFDEKAMALLDLDRMTANDLFFHFDSSRGPVTPAKAAKVIRKLIATGKVSWR